MSLKFAKFNKTADWLNDRLSYFATKEFRKSEFKDQEKLLLADDRFQEAVQAARRRLEIVHEPSSLTADNEQVGDEAILVLEKTNMPIGWFEYICEYIVNGDTGSVQVEAKSHIEVDDADGDEIVVILKRGLTSTEYKAAWDALAVFFDKNPNSFDTTEESRNKKIYFASKRGMSQTAIAKQYFPSEFARDPQAALDRIKKIIKRYKAKI